jgi:hypothetical protein
MPQMEQSSKQSKYSAKVFTFSNLLIIKLLHEFVRLWKELTGSRRNQNPSISKQWLDPVMRDLNHLLLASHKTSYD